MVAKFTVTRGLPGSGKTTWAKGQRDAWLVSRDLVRGMCNARWSHGVESGERLITLIQQELIRLLLTSGVNHVIVDDTNLDWWHVETLLSVARSVRLSELLDVEVKEFLHVPLEVCIERDAGRPDPVGRQVIEAMYRKYMGEESNGSSGS